MAMEHLVSGDSELGMYQTNVYLHGLIFVFINTC